jgi:hypothetical protein
MTVALVLSTIVLAGLYRVSLWWNPVRNCHMCGGTKRHNPGLIFWWSRGQCFSCGGSGVRTRAGTKFVNRRK